MRELKYDFLVTPTLSEHPYNSHTKAWNQVHWSLLRKCPSGHMSDREQQNMHTQKRGLRPHVKALIFSFV